jgi:hypothetical protein
LISALRAVGAIPGEVRRDAAHLACITWSLAYSLSCCSSCSMRAVRHCFMSECCTSQLVAPAPGGGGSSGGEATETGAVRSKVRPQPGPARPSPGRGPRRSRLWSARLGGVELRRARCAAGAAPSAASRFAVAGARCGACRYASKYSARFTSAASLVGAMNILGSSRAQPTALPVICFSTCAATIKRSSGCLSGYSTGSGCAPGTRRPGWGSRAAPSACEASTMMQKSRSDVQ